MSRNPSVVAETFNIILFSDTNETFDMMAKRLMDSASSRMEVCDRRNPKILRGGTRQNKSLKEITSPPMAEFNVLFDLTGLKLIETEFSSLSDKNQI